MKLPVNVEYIIEQLNNSGFEAYVVGGCVRDFIMGKKPKDWDITTSALPEEVKKIFSHTVDTGIEHGTVTVIMDNVGYEVTTFRIDGEYKDNRHPDKVIFTNKLEGDLSRRDFTINAIAYCHKSGFVDMFGGIEDIKNKLIRGVGNAEQRFQEDALRMMRALRFSAQLDFTIEKQTYEAIEKNAQLIKNISVERIRDELVKLIMTDNPEKIMLVRECGMMKFFMPQILENINEKNCRALKISAKNLAVRLAIIFSGTENTDKILKRFTVDNKTNKNVCEILRYGNENTGNNIYEVRKLLCRAGIQVFGDIIEYRSALGVSGVEEIAQLAKKVVENNDCISLKTLEIKGEDIIGLGIGGKMVGEVLEKCLDIVLREPEKNNKALLLEVACKCML